MTHQIKSLIKVLSIRLDKKVESGKIGSIPIGSSAIGDEIYTYTSNVGLSHVGDKWLRITSPIHGWIAAVHRGQVLATITELPPVPIEQPIGGFPKYVRVKHWVERFGKTILEMNYRPPLPAGIPEVWQYTTKAKINHVSMTEPIQRWMFAEFVKSAAGNGMRLADIMRGWASAMNGARAFTNKCGTPQYHDFINGTAEENEPMKLMQIISSGATIKVLRVGLAGSAKIPTAEFEVMDALDPNTLKKTWAEYPHLWFAAVNWSLDRGAEPFPQLGMRHVPIPLLANGVTRATIEEAWLEYLEPNAPLPADPYKY